LSYVPSQQRVEPVDGMLVDALTSRGTSNGDAMTPRISAVVPTRNRPDHAVPCASSILRNAGDDFELLVIDQSDDDATEQALAVYAGDRRFRYARSSSRGASAARNVGVEQSTAAIIAFTDDDCRVSADWLLQISTLFEREPETALVFGKVSIPEELKGKGFAADFEPHQRAYYHKLPPAHVAWGIGANMSARRSLFERLGTFDPFLGPGSPFLAGEESDLAIRALAAGYKVVNAAEIAVLHLGVREGDEASKLMRGYGRAIGATLAKHVRLGTRESKALLLSWFAHFAGKGLLNAALGRRPTGLGLVAGMLAGAYSSLSQPIDRVRGIYISR
jgi:glycosyltransferase involved in cell wall biosynthesis